MKTKKKESIGVIATRHYIIAGFVSPSVIGILIGMLFFALFGAETTSNLISLYSDFGIFLQISTTLIFTLLITMPGFYFGTLWSTDIIRKRYEILNRNKIVNLSAKIYFFVAFILLILDISLSVLSNSLQVGHVTISPTELTSFFLSIFAVFIGATLFYLITQKYFLVS